MISSRSTNTIGDASSSYFDRGPLDARVSVSSVVVSPAVLLEGNFLILASMGASVTISRSSVSDDSSLLVMMFARASNSNMDRSASLDMNPAVDLASMVLADSDNTAGYRSDVILSHDALDISYHFVG